MENIRDSFLVMITISLLAACNQSNSDYSNAVSDTDRLNELNSSAKLSVSDQNTLQLFNDKCMICHGLGTSEETAIAPPMVSVKRRYKMSYDTKEEFVAAMVNFTKNPKDEKVLMVKAHEKFKLMPKLLYDKADLEKIAGFIYENEIEKPEWFAAHFEKEHGNFKTIENANPEKPEVLLHNKCVICHQNSVLQTQPIAPLISDFATAYKKKYKTKEDFSKAIVHFVNNPQKENALLPESVEKYNLMPKLNYSEKTIKIIADYLYDSDIQNVDKQMKEISKSNIPAKNTPESVYNTKCKICHNVNVAQGEMLAPPMVNIRKKYNMIHKSKERFITAIVNFTQSPEQEKAIMFGALKQFELMPKLNYPENDLKMAAEYIYENEFEKPTWFKN